MTNCTIRSLLVLTLVAKALSLVVSLTGSLQAEENCDTLDSLKLEFCNRKPKQRIVFRILTGRLGGGGGGGCHSIVSLVLDQAAALSNSSDESVYR